MADRQSILRELQENPKAVPPPTIHAALLEFGYEMRPARGSQRVYVKKGVRPITIPYERPHVGRFLVHEVVARLKAELDQDGPNGKER